MKIKIGKINLKKCNEELEESENAIYDCVIDYIIIKNSDSRKIKFNPKYFSFEEIFLFENLKTISNISDKNNNILNRELFDHVFKTTVDDYINLNYGQYDHAYKGGERGSVGCHVYMSR